MRLPRALLDAALRLTVKPALRRIDDPGALRRQLERDAALWFRKPAGMTTETAATQGRPALWASARGAKAGAGAVLYLHGGAYIAGSPQTHAHLAAALAAEAGMRALLPDYALAPENPLPAALADARAAWDWLAATGAPGQPLALAGDSAGGGLAFALLAELMAEGAPLPAAVVAFSPWVDLTLSGASIRENASAEAMLPVERMGEAVAMVTKDADPADPRLSPVFARYPGAPPALVFASRDEALRDDAVAMVRRLEADGAQATLVLEPRLPHAWPVFRGWLAEADRDIARAGSFIAGAVTRAG